MLWPQNPVGEFVCMYVKEKDNMGYRVPDDEHVMKVLRIFLVHLFIKYRG